jgi:hypothetical protein
MHASIKNLSTKILNTCLELNIELKKLKDKGFIEEIILIVTRKAQTIYF